MLADTLIVLGLATVSLGTIQESDGVQERAFWLRNCGTDSITLVQGYTSCGCTTIDFARNQPLAPADSACVTLRFNPRGKGGEFEETGTVVYAASRRAGDVAARRRVSLRMVGTCVTSEETLMRQFPIRVNDSLRLSADRFDLGRMAVGETKERSVVLLHRYNNNRQERIPVSFTVSPTTPKGLQHVACPVVTTCAGQELRLTVTLDVFVR